jgi:hypothetical protein
MLASAAGYEKLARRAEAAKGEAPCRVVCVRRRRVDRASLSRIVSARLLASVASHPLHRGRRIIHWDRRVADPALAAKSHLSEHPTTNRVRVVRPGQGGSWSAGT